MKTPRSQKIDTARNGEITMLEKNGQTHVVLTGSAAEDLRVIARHQKVTPQKALSGLFRRKMQVAAVAQEVAHV